MITSNAGVPDAKPMMRAADMAALDRLPEAVRLAIKNAWFPYSSERFEAATLAYGAEKVAAFVPVMDRKRLAQLQELEIAHVVA